MRASFLALRRSAGTLFQVRQRLGCPRGRASGVFASGSAATACVPMSRREGAGRLRTNGTSTLLAERRRTDAPTLARKDEVRSVRTASRLSRPSMGRDTLPPQPRAGAAAGGAGACLAGVSTRCGRRRRAGPVPESGPPTARGLHIASRPADSGRSGRCQMLEAPERQAPALPAAEIREARNDRAQRGHGRLANRR